MQNKNQNLITKILMTSSMVLVLSATVVKAETVWPVDSEPITIIEAQTSELDPEVQKMIEGVEAQQKLESTEDSVEPVKITQPNPLINIWKYKITLPVSEVANFFKGVPRSIKNFFGEVNNIYNNQKYTINRNQYTLNNVKNETNNNYITQRAPDYKFVGENGAEVAFDKASRTVKISMPAVEQSQIITLTEKINKIEFESETLANLNGRYDELAKAVATIEHGSTTVVAQAPLQAGDHISITNGIISAAVPTIDRGYVFGQSTAWADSSTNPGIWLDKTGASGDLLRLQTEGVDRFVVDNSGNININNTTLNGQLNLVQAVNGQTMFAARRATDLAPAGDFISYSNAANNTQLFRVDNAGNIFAGGISNSGSLTISSNSTPQFTIEYDALKKNTTSVSLEGVTTYAFNSNHANGPRAIFIPQTNRTDSFEFQTSTGTPVTTINTTTPGINVAGNIQTGGTTRLDNSGNLSNIGTITSGLINGQTISSSANLTGTLTVSGTGTFGSPAGATGAKVAVAGPVYSDNVGGNEIVLNSNGANYGFILNPVAGKWSLGYGTAIGTLGSSVLTWNTAGQVGIGTTDPQNTLQVNGSAIFKNPTDDFAGGLKFVRSGANTNAYGFTIGSDNNLYFGYNANYANLNLSQNAVLSTVGSWTVPANATFGFDNNNAGASMGPSPDTAISRISANLVGVGNGNQGDFSGTLAAGNVVVGSSSATNKLTVVSGDNTASTNIGLFTANNLTQSVGIGYNSITQLGSGGVLSFDINSRTSGVLNLNNTATGNVVIANGGGNVGIGDVSPTNKLDVNGAIGISDTTVIDASRNLVNVGTITSGLINGQTISSSANFTGTLATANLASLSSLKVTSRDFGNAASNLGIGFTAGSNAAQFWSFGANASTAGLFQFEPRSSDGSLSGVNVQIGGYGSATLGIMGQNNSGRFIESDAFFTSDVTSTASSYYSRGHTTNSAYTLTDYNHFHATDVAKGAANTITNQYGLHVGTLSSATNNYGVYVDSNNSYFGGALTAAGSVTLSGLPSSTTNEKMPVIFKNSAHGLEIDSVLAWNTNQNKLEIDNGADGIHINVSEVRTIYSGDNLSLATPNFNPGIYLVDSTLRVGIGTNNPLEKLDSRGAAFFSGDNATGTNAEGVAHGVLLSSVSSLARISSASNGNNNVDLALSALNAGSRSDNQLRLAAGGNIGIGVTGPGTKLEVAGASLVDGDNRNILRLQDSTSFASGVGAGIELMGLYNTGGSRSSFAGIKGIKENATDGNNAGALVLTTTPNAGSPTERIRVTSTGNVGIGTTGPEFKLHVVDTGVPVTLDRYSDNAGGAVFNMRKARGTAGNPSQVLANDVLGGMDIRGYHSGGSFSSSFVSRMIVGAEEDFTASAWGTYISFETNAPGTISRTEKIRITGSGNVGIGETGPVNKLHIQGSGTSGQVTAAMILENSSSGTLGLDITGSAGSSRARWLRGAGPGTGTNTLTESITLILEGSTAGYVGIGDTSPDYNLEVRTTDVDAADMFAVTADDDEAVFVISKDASDNGIALIYTGAGANNIKFSSSGDSFFTGGNLGIGTTSPDGRLDLQATIDGSSTIASTQLKNILTTEGDAFVSITDNEYLSGLLFNAKAHSSATGAGVTEGAGIYGVAGKNFGSDASSVELAFVTGENGSILERMRIDDDGNVGIGTTSPGSRLTIKQSSDNDAGGIRLVASGAGSEIAMIYRLSDADDALILRNNGIDTVAIENGNVGIGDTSPAALLTVGNGDLFRVDSSANVSIPIGATINLNGSGGNTSIKSFGEFGQAIEHTASGTVTMWEGAWTGGSVQFPNVGTTASAANVFMDSATSNLLLRVTSSLRYKTDVRSLDSEEALQVVLGLRPVLYKSLAPADDPNADFLGLIAEEVALLDTKLVNYDNLGRPDGVQYERVVVPLIKAVQELNAKVDNLNQSGPDTETQISVLDNLDINIKLTVNGEAIFKGAINVEGKLVAADIEAKSIVAEQLKVKNPDQSKTGLVIFDRITGQPTCVVSENGALKSYPGECTDLPAIVTETTPVVETVSSNPEETSATSEEPAVTTETTTETVENPAPSVEEVGGSEPVLESSTTTTTTESTTWTDESAPVEDNSSPGI